MKYVDNGFVEVKKKESNFVEKKKREQVFQKEKAQNTGHKLMETENYRRVSKKKPYLL